MTAAEQRVSVVANAVGFVMLGADGREVTVVDGVEQITATDDEAALCRRAAERALEHLAEFDR